MTTVWKYPLKPGRTVHNMPQGAKVLTVQTQNGEPSLWALVEPQMPHERRFFDVYGTGHSMPSDPGRYVATFQMDYGALVWHVFEGYASASIEPDAPWPRA